MATVKLVNVNGNIVVEPVSSYPTIDHLPAAVYTLGMTSEGNLAFKKERDRFELPAKVYGKNNRYFEAIRSSYEAEPRAVGAMLVGMAGSGKTLLAEQLANWIIAGDRPVFWIKENKIPVNMIRAAIQVAGPTGCLVLFDEMSKLYPAENNESNGETQDSLLTLLSDSSLSKVMFLATDNHSNRVNSYLFDRPGRFLYWIDFTGLDEEEVLEYCRDRKVPTDILPVISHYCKNKQLVYDTLSTVVNVALMSKDVDDFIFRLEILNVPSLDWAKWSLHAVIIKGATSISVAGSLTVSDNESMEVVLEDGKMLVFSYDDGVTSNGILYKYTVDDVEIVLRKTFSKKPLPDVYHSSCNARPTKPKTATFVLSEPMTTYDEEKIFMPFTYTDKP